MALAMHNYREQEGSLPPHALYSKEGKPLLSWRVLILPYIEQADLYKRFKLDEPWDSPHNRTLLAKKPKTYRHPWEDTEETTLTHYKVFVGPGTAFEGQHGRKLEEIPDKEKLLLVVEGGPPVPWSKPEDIPYDPEEPFPQIQSLYKERLNLALADGSLRSLVIPEEWHQLRSLITMPLNRESEGEPDGKR